MTATHQRRWAITALAVTAAMGLAACTSPSPAPDDTGAAGEPRETLSLNVGYIDTSINGVGVIEAANQLDLWEAAGLDVTLTPFTNGPTQIQAMQSGQIDVGYIGGGATWLAATGNAVVIVPSELSRGDVVLAQPGSGIEDPADLAGKRVGYPEGGSGEMMLVLALAEAGLTKDDIEAVVLDPPSVVSAFVGGQIDAAAIFSPLSNQILESVPDTVTVANNDAFPDTAFLGSWVAATGAITEKADAIVRFLEVYAQANDYRIENTDQVVEWAAAAAGAPVEQLAGQAAISVWTPSQEILENNESGFTFEQFESLIDVFVLVGRMDAPTDPADWVNTDLFAQAMDYLK